MVVELRTKSQITIPKEIVLGMGLSQGDQFEVMEKDGMICLIPLATYPKKYLDELRNEVATVKQKIKEGEQPVFDSVDALLESLDDD